jgi:hypothetical protein
VSGRSGAAGIASRIPAPRMGGAVEVRPYELVTALSMTVGLGAAARLARDQDDLTKGLAEGRARPRSLARALAEDAGQGSPPTFAR